MNCWTNSSTNSIWKKRGCIDALCGIWGVGKSLPCFMQRYGLMLPEELAGWVLAQTMVHGSRSAAKWRGATQEPGLRARDLNPHELLWRCGEGLIVAHNDRLIC